MKTVEILLVFPSLKREQKLLVWEKLSSDLVGGQMKVTVTPATTRDEVLARLAEGTDGPDLIVAHMQLAAREKTSPDPRGGLALVREVRKRGTRVPVVLVSEITDTNIQATRDRLERCRLVIEGAQDWEDSLLKRCQEELGAAQEGEAQPGQGKRGQVDIFLNIDQVPQGHYRMVAPGFSSTDKPLKLDTFIMRDLARRSKNVRQVEDWQGEFHAIGNYLLRELFMQNFSFAQDFKEVLHRAGGEENLGIRFIVEKSSHPIALEALLDERDDFWMLHAPVYRRVQVTGVKPPLFSEGPSHEGPLRCLVIEADTSGTVPGVFGADGKELGLCRLSNASQEGAFLSRFLKSQAATYEVEEVERLYGSGRKKPTLERVRQVLTEQGPWPLVHFAGHSHFDDERDTGYVFFPGTTGPAPLPVDDFARYLRKADTRFVYLSSCQSSAADFAFALAKQGVPAIVGFRWDIEDDKAVHHAQTFYRQLFEKGKALEYAFLETHKAMYEEDRDNRIWAAAMLIIQVERH